MNKIYFSEQSEQDLSDIVIGLLLWQKVRITEIEALEYVDDIYDIAYTIPDLSYHQKCTYIMHQQYGEYHLKYNRNYRTTWYIIYDIDIQTGNFLIQRIMSNYKTIE